MAQHNPCVQILSTQWLKLAGIAIPQREEGIQHGKTPDSSRLIAGPLIAMIKYST